MMGEKGFHLEGCTVDADMVVDGGVLLTMVRGQPPTENAKVFIKGNHIAAIRTSRESPSAYGGAQTIQARQGIIMPGLVNAHTHTAMTLFRGLADDLPLQEWLFQRIFPAEAKHLNPETVYWGTLLGCLEMIASGTTGVVEGYFYQDATCRALHESGLRGLVAQGIIDFPAPGVDDPKKNLEVGREFVEKWHDRSERIRPGLFCHSPLTCSEKTLAKALDISRAYGLPLQIHLSETSAEIEEIMKNTGMRPVEYLDKIGLLNEDLIAAHAVHLDDHEIERLAQRNVKLVHVPESNMKLASGVARVSKMIEAGLTVGIGTDGCASNNNLDLFREMDTAAKLAKVFDGNPVALDAETVLLMATAWGGSLLPSPGDSGTIQEGKLADIIVLESENPHLVPMYNPMSTLVYAANGADVKDVIVDGRILMRDRVFLTLDAERIMTEVRAIGRRIAG
jgi:5-methylthioadenosine/S-adenosylhomocysteine deaminase